MAIPHHIPSVRDSKHGVSRTQRGLSDCHEGIGRKHFDDGYALNVYRAQGAAYDRAHAPRPRLRLNGGAVRLAFGAGHDRRVATGAGHAGVQSGQGYESGQG